MSDAQRTRFRGEKIGFIFQSFNLLPRLTALENVALPLAYKGFTRTRRIKQASQMLERVGVQTREYFLPSQLVQERRAFDRFERR